MGAWMHGARALAFRSMQRMQQHTTYVSSFSSSNSFGNRSGGENFETCNAWRRVVLRLDAGGHV